MTSRAALSKLRAVGDSEVCSELYERGFESVSALYELKLLIKSRPDLARVVIERIKNGEKVTRREIEWLRKEKSQASTGKIGVQRPALQTVSVKASISGLSCELDLMNPSARPGYIRVKFRSGDRAEYPADEVQIVSVVRESV